VKKNSTPQNLPYNTTHKLANIYLVQKRHDFDPLLKSSMQQASENLKHEGWRAEILARSTSTLLQTEKFGKKLQHYKDIVESWLL
jgi:hypothetical protein